MMRYEWQLKTVLVKLHHSHTVSLPTAPTAGAIDANVMMDDGHRIGPIRVTRNLLLAPDKARNALRTWSNK